MSSDENATAACGEGDILAPSPDEDSEQAALRARLDKLSRNLGGRGKVKDNAPSTSQGGGDTGFGNAMGAGIRVVTELIAGILVGGGLGWLIDRGLNTKPLFMILIGCLGLAGGFWNIIREAMKPTGKK